jgi:hypothetical protein
MQDSRDDTTQFIKEQRELKELHLLDVFGVSATRSSRKPAKISPLGILAKSLSSAPSAAIKSIKRPDGPSVRKVESFWDSCKDVNIFGFSVGLENGWEEALNLVEIEGRGAGIKSREIVGVPGEKLVD